MKTIDASGAIKSLRKKHAELFSPLRTELRSEIDSNDGMFSSSNQEYYFRCGLEAIQLIRIACRFSGIRTDNIHSILDFACGYGRVTRALLAAYPQAHVLAIDIDNKALAAVARLFDIETLCCNRTLDNLELQESFDLIWVGSLFTHIRQEFAEKVLRTLRGHLNGNGLLVFTTHGNFVRDRIEKEERDYNLTPESLKTLMESEKHTYAFTSYSNNPNYGISITPPMVMMGCLKKVGLEPKMFLERGWVKHQDVYACSL